MTMASFREGGGGGGRGGGMGPHDRQRRIALKCVELEGMLESQG